MYRSGAGLTPPPIKFVRVWFRTLGCFPSYPLAWLAGSTLLLLSRGVSSTLLVLPVRCTNGCLLVQAQTGHGPSKRNATPFLLISIQSGMTLSQKAVPSSLVV